jgi:histidinol-phosphate aminotransferase
MAIAHPEIIQAFSKVQMPYKLSSVVLQLAEQALSEEGQACARARQRQIISDRDSLVCMLADPFIADHGIGPVVGGQAANFLLVPILVEGQRDDARARFVTEQLRERHGISIRYVGGQARCNGCVRITVGTAAETETLRKALRAVLLETD